MQRVKHGVDILIFNPPYVPTEDMESEDAQEGKDIRGAWAGGMHGLQVTDLLLESVNVSQSYAVLGTRSHQTFCRVYSLPMACFTLLR